MKNPRHDAQTWIEHVATCGVCEAYGKEGWQSGDIAPPEPGWYERLYGDGMFRHYFDGRVWRSRPDVPAHWRQVGDYPCWRGPVEAPAQKVTISEVERLRRENAGLEENLRAARNLLAVIHRDGGHYTHEHGFLKSCMDAESEVVRLREEVEFRKGNEAAERRLVEALRERVRVMEEALRPFSESGATGCLLREDYSVMRERLKDWFGVSDFLRARAALEAVKEEKP